MAEEPTNEEEAVAEEEESAAAGGEEDADPEIEEMKRKVQEMEEEAAKLKEMQQEVEKQMATTGAGGGSPGAGAAAAAADETSVFVGQVDYEATPEELQAHFASCGTINRVTILCDKFTGRPKGFAYIEFNDKESIEHAILLDNSLFKGRQLKVVQKRVNEPGFKKGGKGKGRGKGKGKGGKGRGRGKGGWRGSW